MSFEKDANIATHDVSSFQVWHELEESFSENADALPVASTANRQPAKEIGGVAAVAHSRFVSSPVDALHFLTDHFLF